MPKVLAAGLVIYRVKSQVVEYLLLQASYSKNHHWTPPKGHVEQGEDLLETALRETEEESGISTNQLKLTDCKIVLNYTVKGKPKEVTYWLAEYVGKKENPVVLSHEHRDFKWSTLTQALGYVKYGNTKSLLKQCQKYIDSKK